MNMNMLAREWYVELHGAGILMEDACGHEPRNAARLQEAEEAVDEEEEDGDDEEVERPHGVVEGQYEEEWGQKYMQVEEELVARAPDTRMGGRGHGQAYAQRGHARNDRTRLRIRLPRDDLIKLYFTKNYPSQRKWLI